MQTGIKSGGFGAMRMEGSFGSWWFLTWCLVPSLEFQLNLDGALQGPFEGSAPNKICGKG